MKDRVAELLDRLESFSEGSKIRQAVYETDVADCYKEGFNAALALVDEIVDGYRDLGE